MYGWMDQSNDLWIDGSMDLWIDQLMYWPMDWLIDRCIDRWINGLMDQMIYRSIDQLINWSIDQWMDWRMDEWMDRSMDWCMDQSMGGWMDGGMDRGAFYKGDKDQSMGTVVIGGGEGWGEGQLWGIHQHDKVCRQEYCKRGLWSPCRRQRELESVCLWDKEQGLSHYWWQVNTFQNIEMYHWSCRWCAI